eukprot:1160063-Pelagomonas_calceolata.AAC.4
MTGCWPLGAGATLEADPHNGATSLCMKGIACWNVIGASSCAQACLWASRERRRAPDGGGMKQVGCWELAHLISMGSSSFSRTIHCKCDVERLVSGEADAVLPASMASSLCAGKKWPEHDGRPRQHNPRFWLDPISTAKECTRTQQECACTGGGRTHERTHLQLVPACTRGTQEETAYTKEETACTRGGWMHRMRMHAEGEACAPCTCMHRRSRPGTFVLLFSFACMRPFSVAPCGCGVKA